MDSFSAPVGDIIHGCTTFIMMYCSILVVTGNFTQESIPPDDLINSNQLQMLFSV